ncbi:uncharacterized protein LOC128260253 [Drosophila gunungcola]|uniref:uncharacterized protein LOC128260253 n=1 Tax=Drosophila gunungcola TaxID=103775 RepID=UPI0022E35951|nr:uncharacterized protein LOC128260253 [Drosophila gunungcola]
MKLGKWVSNSSRISEATLTSEGKGFHSTAKVLGIHWDPKQDTLSFKVCLSSNPKNSKRQVLSDVARIFDPLGVLSPVVVQFKILFQELWLLDLCWDTELPPKVAEWWNKCRNDLNALQELRMPRFIDNKENHIELHGFSDASIKAYSAVVYSRLVRSNGTVSVSLIAGKTTVAPLKQQSLPRLELCGALLLINQNALQHKDIVIHAWCDSTIVLAWLSHPPSKLKTFVANRTTEILDTIPRNAWNHVNTKENPADCATRGMLAAELIHFDLWWMGPPWLQDQEKLEVKLSCQKFCSSISENHGKEEVKTTALTTHEVILLSPIEALAQRVSSWTKMMQAVRILCLQEAQKCFKNDYNLLMEDKPLQSRSQLIKLSPIISKDGLLRHYKDDYGTRTCVKSAPWSFSTFCHYPPKILGLWRTQPIIRTLVPNCIKCKERRGRNPWKTKGYICLFVCLVTSAIHLELATDLSTDTFIACLRRIMSLRGKCSQTGRILLVPSGL